MGHHRQQPKAGTKSGRKRRPAVSEMEELHSAEPQAEFAHYPDAIMHLQHTIGNRAVQRLMRDTQQHDYMDAVVPAAALQRAPEDAPRSLVLLSLELNRKGKVKGSSRTAGHEGKIEVFSVSLKEARGGKAITFNKGVDDSSTVLHEALLTGDQVKSAEFTFLRRKEDGSLETVYTLQFENGMISSFSLSGGGNEPSEAVELDFSKPEEETRQTP